MQLTTATKLIFDVKNKTPNIKTNSENISEQEWRKLLKLLKEIDLSNVFLKFTPFN